MDYLYNSDIDFVILWVDGNDRKWLQKKAQYVPNLTADVSKERYRDWDNLKYWFRGVAKYAPWVRKIHFVTDEQVPEWLNTEIRIFIVSIIRIIFLKMYCRCLILML